MVSFSSSSAAAVSAVLLFAVIGSVASAEYPVNITVSLGGNAWATGKMYLELIASKWTEKVLLQQHMQALRPGNTYSSTHKLGFPVDNVTSTSLMWFKKKWAMGGNTLYINKVTLEPSYLTTVYETRIKTKVFCGSRVPTETKSEYPASLEVNCRGY